jgi:hypothetical protein
LYFELRCVSCCTAVGKLYHTTPKSLDYLRDHYCLSWNRLRCYAIGGGQVSGSTSSAFPSLEELWARINQITETLLRQSERIEGIENYIVTRDAHGSKHS